MTTKPILPDFERLRYWQGQRLLSRDFRDQMAVAEQMRWWHNRALHNAFGISYGLSVTPQQTGGKLSGLTVGCGVAYDCYGRELVLQTNKEVPIPLIGSSRFSRLTLLIRYKQTTEFQGNQLAETCRPNCCPGLPEEPEFEWKPTACLEIADGVPIAELRWESSVQIGELPAGFQIPDALKSRLRYNARRQALVFYGAITPDDEKLIIDSLTAVNLGGRAEELIEKARQAPVLDFGSVRLARALARPRIGSGSTVPGDTPWEVWSERITGNTLRLTAVPVGIQVTIDTSAAGFTETPCYFAWLQGPLWNRTNQQFFPVPLQHIDKETTQSFRFRMWMPSIITLFGGRVRFANINSAANLFEQKARGFPVEFINFARQQLLYVCWTGIQELPAPECHPPKPRVCVTENEV